MPQALALLEHLMQNAKVDKDAWQQLIALEEKSRNDAKLNQQQNFSRLVQYGIYGPYNPARHDLSIDQLRQQDPQELLTLAEEPLEVRAHRVILWSPQRAGIGEGGHEGSQDTQETHGRARGKALYDAGYTAE